MPKGIYIVDQEYTFEETVHLLAQAISLILDDDDNGVFSIADILCLLRSVNEYVPGEFEVQQPDSHYYYVVYKSEDEVVERFKKKWEGFIE